MKRTAARLALGATAWVVIAVAALLIVRSERYQIADRTQLQAFDVRTHEVSVALADLRTAQQAFVAPGQGHGFWASKADEFLASVESGLTELRDRARTAESRRSLSDAAAALTELRSISERAKHELAEDQPFSSAGTIFTEGSETAKDVAARLEAARQAERAGADEFAAAERRNQAQQAGLAALVSTGIIALLAWMPSRRPSDQHQQSGRTRASEATTASSVAPRAQSSRGEQPAASGDRPDPAVPGPVGPELWLRDRFAASPPVPRESVPALRVSAELCTDLSRVRDLSDLTALLERVATALDAAGLIVWVGKPGGMSVRPVLAHGYSSEALARMPSVPRSSDNAAAAAYRTGTLQIVLARPGMSAGAIAAPMLTSDGCIGALTAEIRGGGEASDGVQAIAAIIAAQFSGLLAASVAAAEDEPTRVSA